MDRYGVGILGAGWVSTEHIRCYQRNPHTEVVAICSRSQEGASEKLEETGQEARIYSNYEQMLADQDVRIVSICTPSNFHAQQAIVAAQAGKHVVVEKPIALNLEDLRSLRDAVRKTRVKTIVPFVLRWNPLVQTIKTLVNVDVFGRLFYAEVDYLHGIGPWYKQFAWNKRKTSAGSSFLTAGCHAVDTLRWILQDEPIEITAYSTRGDGPPFDQYDYDPTQILLARFRGGAVGKVLSSIESKMPYVFSIQLLGSKGSLRNNQIWAKDHLFPGQTGFVTVPTILPDSGDVSHLPFQQEIDHFLDCILDDRESHVNVEDAVKTHEICLAAAMAAEEGRPVKMPLL